MCAVPGVTPPTVPVVVTVAAPVIFVAVQVPEGVALANNVVPPWQTMPVPVIAVGTGFTVATLTVWQPVDNLYVIFALPAMLPVIIPVVLPMFAIVKLLLSHVPPAVALVTVVVEPIQTLNAPAEATGTIFTVSTAVLVQPVDAVYVIIVVQGATVVTKPVPAAIVATEPVELSHVPPATLFVRVVVAPSQMLSAPPIAGGETILVTLYVDLQPVGSV